jgi:hypothetical protein
MIEIKMVNSEIQHLSFEYHDVKIELTLMNNITDIGGNIYLQNVDSISLYHKKAGDITNMYTHNTNYEIDPGDTVVGELKDIIKFIDELIIFKKLVSKQPE